MVCYCNVQAWHHRKGNMNRGTFEATVVHILSMWILGYLTSDEAMQQIEMHASEFEIILEDKPV